MDTQTQIDRLIELAIIQRTELKQLVEQLPQLREHLNAEVEKVFEETEPQLRAELEEWTTKQTADKTAALGVTLEAKIAELAKSLEVSTQARYNAIIAEREENARLAAQAEAKIAEHAASLPSAVKEIVSAELARFPRAGEIDQLRKEFAEPRGLNPRGKWQAGETYNRLDLVTYNGDSFVSNIDGNTEKPSRNAANWTLNAARGAYGGGGGITSLNDVLNAPTSGQIIGSQNGQYVPKTLVAGANITINETASSITIIGDEGQISLNDGTAASPALFFTNDTDTGLYRPTANTLGISVSGTQVAYFDANGITTVGAGATFDGSVHAANGNANNPSLSFTGDQDTGFFRHQPNELGIALGGTQYATLTSTTFSITPNLSTSGNLTVSGTGTSTIGGNLTVNGTANLTGIVTTNSSTGFTTFGGRVVIADSSGIRGTSSTIGLFSASGVAYFGNYDSATGLKITLSTGAAEFTNNLIVSGSIVNQNGVIQSTLAAGALISSLSTNNNAVHGFQISGSGTGSRDWRLEQGRAGANSFSISNATGGLTTPLIVNGATNNILIGCSSTSSDSGNGKLQLADHTTSAGGIGFGTETSLYRYAGGIIGLDHIGGSIPGLNLLASGTRIISIYGASNSLYLDTFNAAGAMYLRTGAQTTALTLDASQNATFAGTISQTQAAAGSTPNLTLAESGIRGWNFYATGGKMSIRPSSPGTWSFNGNTDVELVRTTASTSTTTGALVVSGGVGVAGAVNVGGAIAIGNTVQTAASVASTHKVTVVIGGVTYYLLATNV